MNRLIKKTKNLATNVVGAMIVLMMVHVTTEVLLRLLFGMHIPGTMEVVAYYYMVAAVFIGIFICVVEDSHIRVDVLVQHFSKRMRSATDLFGLLVMTLYFALFSYGLYLQAVKSWGRREGVDAVFFELSIWPSRWIAWTGVFMAALAAVYLLIRLLRGKSGREVSS